MRTPPARDEDRTRFVPALGFAALSPLYDAVMAATMREGKFRATLLEQASLGPGHEVLDLGCGTGSLLVALGRHCSGVKATGLDPDPEVLAIAACKARAAGVAAHFDSGLATRLPYADGSFDRVLSSLMFHHLSPMDKRKAAAEVRRILRPGGELHVVDWGRPANLLMGSLFLAVRLLDGYPNTRDNVKGRLPAIFRDAGFAAVEETGTMSTMFGTLAFLRALKWPAEGRSPGA